ncbi:heavy-metal-associated domain-containing protein [Alkaliphilus crotonatoxidans]
MKRKISIEGMSCGHCANHVKNALIEVAGITDVKVDLAGKNAIIEMSQPIEDETLRAAISEVGYDVVNIESL